MKARQPGSKVARRIALLASAIGLMTALSGCGLAAAPCRIASAGLKIVPVVGHVAAAPTDACADVIDP
ncbi:hypothetical protein PTKU46_21530 [Paraburkholderia terrae]|uniref:Phosphoribosylglycinamide formyltransferase n=2 Tax=Paraburkholderia TaxID=1822464 RepID=A0A7Z7B9F4_9BURK|nr:MULTISPECIES: DUF6726 family protein [Paraburkholderia]AUT61192.1 hypothetical protein C2L65_10940 [Paraburkholderia terrae]MDW3657729.1 hypothetical protein [Paraburkholderia terrae]SDI02901.1 hypothetical protein SAMN04487926_11134 [Paraburkholderia steynii]